MSKELFEQARVQANKKCFANSQLKRLYVYKYYMMLLKLKMFENAI